MDLLVHIIVRGIFTLGAIMVIQVPFMFRRYRENLLDKGFTCKRTKLSIFTGQSQIG